MKKKLKKLVVCLFASILGAVTVVAPVTAKTFEDVRDTYTQTYYGAKSYSSEQRNALKKQCKVDHPENLYMDSYLLEIAQVCVDEGYKIYDLRSMAEYGLDALLCDNGLVFNYGFRIESNLSIQKDITIYKCKCSPNDFKRLKKYKKKYITHDVDVFFSTIESDGRERSFSYDTYKKILEVTVHH